MGLSLQFFTSGHWYSSLRFLVHWHNLYEIESVESR